MAAAESLAEAQRQPSRKDRRGGNRHRIEVRSYAERAATDVIGLQAYQRQSKQSRDERRQGRVLELCRPVEGRPCRVLGGEPGVGRHYTFSSSGRPNSPVGRKTSTRIRTAKTETSL